MLLTRALAVRQALARLRLGLPSVSCDWERRSASGGAQRGGEPRQQQGGPRGGQRWGGGNRDRDDAPQQQQQQQRRRDDGRPGPRGGGSFGGGAGGGGGYGGGGGGRARDDDENEVDARLENLPKRLANVREMTAAAHNPRVPTNVDRLGAEADYLPGYDAERLPHDSGDDIRGGLDVDPDRLAQVTLPSPQARVSSLTADPYGWAPSQRVPKEAPLWMLYEAEREEVALLDVTKGETKKRADNPVGIAPPMRDEQGRAYATGRRKTAVARVWIKAGDGSFVVNRTSLSSYLPMLSDRRIALEPMIATQSCGAFDVWLTVKGGGITGQAGAIKHGLANALVRYDPYLKPALKKLGLLMRDPRMVERKKPGQVKARKRFQWVAR